MAQSNRSSIWGLVAPLLLLAGCAAPSQPQDLPPEGGSPLPPSSGGPDGSHEECSIDGTVAQPGGLPIEGALVIVYGTERLIRTAPDGRFAFDALLPGPYELLASKTSFHPFREDFVCRAGQTITFNVELSPEPPPEKRRYEPQPLVGRIGCSARVLWYSLGADPCATAGAAPDATPTLVLTPPVGRVTAITLVLEWQPTTGATSETLALYLPKPRTANYTVQTSGTLLAVDPMRVTGASPLAITLVADAVAGDQLYTISDLEPSLTFSVRVPVPTQATFLEDPMGAAPADAVVDQGYELRPILYYDGAPVDV